MFFPQLPGTDLQRSAKYSLINHTIMKPFQSKQAIFCGLLGLSGAFYLVDCLVVSILDKHTDLPWIERGIYAPGPAGILTTASCLIAGFWILIFLKDK
jgi:hypothetical protein